MQIARRAISPDEPPYVIAEIGVNHDGSVDRGVELVRAAASAGADAIKLQLFREDLILSRAAKPAQYQIAAGAPEPHELLRSLELSAKQMQPMIDEARHVGVHAIVTVFNLELVEEAETLNVDAYKTASPDLVNRPLIEALMRTGRPLILSAGAATLDEVRNATQWLGGFPHLLMQCVSAYPAPDECAALAGRLAMLEVNPNSLGYSDHTTALDTGAMAVASGVCLLEKHLTHDRMAHGPDHAASLEPAGFAEYVQLAHRAWRMLGPRTKNVLDIERDVREVSRQSLTVKRDLPAGHVLAREDLAVKRPGAGLAPSLMEFVLGRSLARAVAADTPLHEDDLR